jgi:membrane dipeptidase
MAAQDPETKKGPMDFITVIGHYDIWEFNDRFELGEEAQSSPLRDHLLPRLLEANMGVVIMPAAGEAARHRIENDQVLAGSLRSIDMLLTEIEKTDGKASVILTKADVPEKPDPEHVKFFLDCEGGSPIEIPAEPGLHQNHRMGILRMFFRAGVRGLQITRDGRNQLGDGWLEGEGGKLSRFGVEVVQEMNRLGMLVGVSHVSTNSVLSAAEVSTKPIVSSHSNPRRFTKTVRDHTDEEIRAIAATGGVIGVRYLGAGEALKDPAYNADRYGAMVDWVSYMADMVGIDHVGYAWLGHDVGHPRKGYVPGYFQGPVPGNGPIEGLTKYEQNSRFIDKLYSRDYSDDEVAKILGGNFLRVMKEVLPD